jgi:chromosome segregation ATPase
MKNFLNNLLLFFALCLCGLVAFQWVRETDLRKNLQARADELHDKMENIQSLQGAVRQDETEIKRLDGLKNQLAATVKTNLQEFATLTKGLDKANLENEKNQHQLEVYKEALQTANDNIKKQNEEMKQQNDAIEQQNQAIKKQNEEMQQLAAKYTELVGKWNKQQEDLAKAATNAAAKK